MKEIINNSEMLAETIEIPNGWNTVTLSDIAELLDYKRVPLNSRVRDSRRGIYPYYGASGIVDYVDDYIFDGEYVLISEDGENLRSRQTPIAFIAKDKFWVNNHAHIILGKSDFMNWFIVYYFKNIDINPYITGAVQPKLNQDNLLKIPIHLPPDIEREGIVQILKAFDDKIELNHQMNKTLEAIGQALFKRLFLDFEYTNSAGWQVDELGKYIQFIKGKKPSQTSETQLAGYKPQILVDNLNGNASLYANENGMIIVEINEPVMVMDGASSGRVEIGHSGILGSTLAKVIVKNDRLSNLFLYYFLKDKEPDINQNTTGTSIPHTDKEKIKRYQCNLPPKDLLGKFNEIAGRIINNVIANNRETKILIQIRDSLLPKLMSGKIRVN